MNIEVLGDKIEALHDFVSTKSNDDNSLLDTELQSHIAEILKAFAEFIDTDYTDAQIDNLLYHIYSGK